MTRAARALLVAILVSVVAVCVLTLATIASCSRAHHSKEGVNHEAPRVTPGPVAGSAGSRTTIAIAHDAERRIAPARSATSGPIGFDTERDSEVNVQAVSVRFEQPANPNCKRQRSLRSSPRGLNGVERARLSSSAPASTPTRDRSRHCASAAQIQRMVEGFRSPGSIGRRRASNADYARERASDATFVDPGSIPGGSTLDNQPTEITTCKNRPSAESSTTTQPQIKKSHTPRPWPTCTTPRASTWVSSLTAEPGRTKRASATAKAPRAFPALAGAGRLASSGAPMGEELGPIYWRVWLLADPKKWERVHCVTRLEAIRKGAAPLGVSTKPWLVDAEVERS